jgi:hypothetical protein
MIQNLSDEPLSLRWARWFASTHMDRLQEAQALKLNRDTGIISRETAVTILAPDYDIEDVDEELARLDQEQAAREVRFVAEGAQIQVRETGDAAE